MKKRFPIINPKICTPDKCNNGVCCIVALCTMKNIIQDEPGETPFPFSSCKACGKCVAGCPLKAVSLE